MTTLKEMYRPWSLDTGEWGLEILQGPYKDLVIQIEKIDFAQEEASLQLEFHAISMPETLVKEDLDKADFNDTMQLIISNILSEAIANYKDDN